MGELTGELDDLAGLADHLTLVLVGLLATSHALGMDGPATQLGTWPKDPGRSAARLAAPDATAGLTQHLKDKLVGSLRDPTSIRKIEARQVAIR